MKIDQPIQEAWLFTSEIEGERAGSFRQERWSQVFLEADFPIRIFNVRGGVGLTRAYFKSEPEFREFRQQAVRQTKPRPSVREGFLARVLRRIKHLFLVDLYYPNILRLILHSLRELRRSRRRVFILASSPPFSLAVAGAILKVLRPRQVVLGVDMRDPWAKHRSLGGIKALKHAIERWVLGHATGLSTVSYGLKEEFEENYPVTVDVLYNVATHYFTVPPQRKVDWETLNPHIGLQRTKLVYTGSTPEGFYDLPALVTAMKEFRRSTPHLADRLQLVFVGACDEVQRELKRQHLEGHDVVFITHVPHEMAKAIQQNAEGMLYLTYCGKGAVSTKIFEYFALGKPIFPLFVPRNSDVDRLLETYTGISYNLHTPAEILSLLRQVAAAANLASLPRVACPEAVRPLLDAYKEYVRRLRSV